MASAVVFVFLLDSLPGFNGVLNKTLHEAKFETPTTLHLSSTIKPCSAFALNEILKSLHKELDLQTIPPLRTDEIKPNEISRLSAETLYHLGTVLDISDQDFNETPPNNINNDLNSEHSDCQDDMKVMESVVINNDTKDFPESAPFLVAIFETLSNVTAQTCAGTLMSPHWVLTAASCVNLLGNFYSNVTSKSIYTVVQNSSDPLTDGTAYNVTTVLLHPEYKHRVKRLSPMLVPVTNEKAHLALMRIEPAVEGVQEMVVDGAGVGDAVRVYGWMMVKNGTGNSTMLATTLPARTIPCETDFSPVLCLSCNNTVINQLSSGGPVLTIQNNEVRVLAVAQTDERTVVGYPLYKHYKWIQNVLASK